MRKILFTLLTFFLLCSCKTVREIGENNYYKNSYHTDSVFIDNSKYEKDSVIVYKNDTMTVIREYHYRSKDSIQFKTVRDTVYVEYKDTVVKLESESLLSKVTKYADFILLTLLSVTAIGCIIWLTKKLS